MATRSGREYLAISLDVAQDVLSSLDLVIAESVLGLAKLKRLEMSASQSFARIGTDDLSFEFACMTLYELVAMDKPREHADSHQAHKNRAA